MAYERVTGVLGPERDDLHAAIIASTIVNVNRKKGKKPVKPQAFIPKWDQSKKRQTVSGQLAMLKQANTRFKGFDRSAPAKPAPQDPRPGTRYEAREVDQLAHVIDTHTGETEWTGLDMGQARQVAKNLNRI